MPRLSKSTSVITEEFKLGSDIMVVRHTYTYVDGFDAKRVTDKYVKRHGWTRVATSTREHKTINGLVWVVEEIFVANGSLTWKQ